MVLRRLRSPGPAPAAGWVLSDYLRACGRHAGTFALVVLLGGTGGVVVAALDTPVYTAAASVLVTPTGVTDPNPGKNRAPATVDLDTEIQLAQSQSVIAEAADAIGISAQRMRRRLFLSVPPNSRVLRFTFTGFSPAEAARAANAAADTYLTHRRDAAEAVLGGQVKRKDTQIADLEKQLRAASDDLADQDSDTGAGLVAQSQVQLLTRQVSNARDRAQELRLVVVTPGETLVIAQPPRRSSGIAVGQSALGGVMLGLLAACLLVQLLESRQRRIHGLAELASVLPPGTVALGAGRQSLGHRPDDLVSALVRRFPAGGVIAVIRAGGRSPQVGALEMARAVQRGHYRTVVAVWPRPRSAPAASGDPGDPGGPLPTGPGMAEFLLAPGSHPFDYAQVVDGVWLLAAGEAVQAATAATGKLGTREALDRLGADVDFAFIQVDGSRPHTSAVTRAADAVLLVAQDRVTTAAEISKLLDLLGPERVPGVFLLPAPAVQVRRSIRRRLQPRPTARVPAVAGR